MKVSILTLVLVLGLALGKDLCKAKLRMNVQGTVLQEYGILETKNDSYPAGTFWKDDQAEGHWWVCPCLWASCIRICDKEFAEEVIEDSSGFKPVTHYQWKEITETDTPPIEFFKQIRNAKCGGASHILNKEDVRILSSGKMRLENKTKLYGAAHYCVHQMEGKTSIHLVHCVEEEFEDEQFPVEYHIYSFISLLSSILLILTVVAYTLSPQIESFHRKSVIFYAAYQAANFSAMTVHIYFSGNALVKSRCFFIGYIGLYSHLASMFWLNSLCIDIFFAYKGVLRKGSNYFAKFAAYSTCLPIPIVAVALYFNLIINEFSIFDPKTEDGICWADDLNAEWIYNFGPTLILLLANLGLLSATWARGEPVRIRTSEETDQTVPQENERRRTYLILTLLAFQPFINEANPFFYDDSMMVAIFGASRGVLVFLLLVCADKYARKSLSSRFCKGQRAQVI